MPRGGARPGAGRPKGSIEKPRILVEGAPGALTSLPPAREVYQKRLDEGATPEVQAVIDRALSRINDVMEQRVHPAMAGSVLKASQQILEELRGPEVQKVEQKIDMTVKLAELIRMLDDTEKGAPALPAKER